MTTSRIPLAWIAIATTLTLALAADAWASRQGEPPDAPYAVRFDEPPATERRAVSATPGEIAAAILTLSGFLTLIAGNLVRWSRDASWKERSVFAPKLPRE